MNCYIYTRVSTEVEVDGYSLEAQKERLRREAAHRGMKVVGEYSDEGRSGKNITVELHVAADDMGKVIGKQGRIAKAIRSVVKAASSKENIKVDVEIV